MKYTAVSGPDTSKLIGSWVRPDGGYLLEIKSIDKGGSMQATYFNQRPINIARAEWKLRDGLLMMYVELRDVNYPGSAYKLQYNPASDQLEGIYFQAVDKQNFGIFFTRKKSD